MTNDGRLKIYDENETQWAYVGAGEPGAAGDTGASGDTGVAGSQGDTGQQGIAGDTGIQGDTGSGIQGDTGIQGETGPQGTQGNQGDTGIQGDTGADSTVAGDTGIQGDTGAQGTQGIQGNTGITGDTGGQGDTGADSTVAGDTGVQGDTGIQGDTGAIVNPLDEEIDLGENYGLALDAALSADGKYSGIVRSGTAGAALSFGELCYLDPTDSRWELADANSASGADGDCRGILGICVLAAAGDGNATKMLLWGVVRADTQFPTFTINGPVYASETAGEVVVTQPTTTDVVVRVVGFGWTGDELFFCPNSHYFTHT